jgi:16S rRNA C1402 N4-methylase RsmH
MNTKLIKLGIDSFTDSNSFGTVTPISINQNLKNQMMTKTDVVKHFREFILPAVFKRYGNDKQARRQAWAVYTDTLCRNKQITQLQHETWYTPDP